MNREAFLDRIRDALHRETNAPHEVPPALLEPLASWDTEGLVEGFTKELEAVGAQVHLVEGVEGARRVLEGLLEKTGATSYIRSNDAIVDDVFAKPSLPEAGDPAEADVGITGATFGVANTGTLVLTSEAGRKASLLPMTHIALLLVDRLVPTMAEALEVYLEEHENMPSAWVQATGPSRTADIELTLTTGVHGPGVAHVILIAEA